MIDISKAKDPNRIKDRTDALFPGRFISRLDAFSKKRDTYTVLRVIDYIVDEQTNEIRDAIIEVANDNTGYIETIETTLFEGRYMESFL